MDSADGRRGAPANGTPAWGLEQLARAIVSKAAALLDVRGDQHRDRLFDAGATSVDAVRLVAVLDRGLNVRSESGRRRLRRRRSHGASFQRWLGSPTHRALPQVRRRPPGLLNSPAASAPAATATASTAPTTYHDCIAEAPTSRRPAPVAPGRHTPRGRRPRRGPGPHRWPTSRTCGPAPWWAATRNPVPPCRVR
ncbi:hypothetical protein LV779_14995 [Streptomyces thinghirensis]|nr:hypothetical protein [Streptomyces thinghirensis]